MVSLLHKKDLAYIVGIALGDGNLSNPNGRAVRLRITCDTKYPKIIRSISESIKRLLPENKVSIVRRNKNYIDISCYSNKWPGLLGWHAGDKYSQNVSVPSWVKEKKSLSKLCLLGLLQTDGSIYTDRGYRMVNFVTTIEKLALNSQELISIAGFECNIYKIKQGIRRTRYNVRISKNVDKFIKSTSFSKK